MTRPVGAAGLALIKKWEGCRLTAYLDAVGVPTIGYGHTVGVKLGMTITQEEAERFLIEDCQHYADAVDDRAYVPVTAELNANQRDALISFAYNCGTGSLKQLCRGRTVQQIAQHITAYNKGINGVKLQGLVNRRADELRLYNTPVGAKSETINEGGVALEKRYMTVEGCPLWAQETVKKMIDREIMAGVDGGLDLSLDMIRLLVWMDRAGVFGEILH